ncbi:MAG: hypothetical protein FWC69_04995, partial [Defluviitaleaceae bacterium]|nr:hypothetical protein [Defluviitaleaceae bacterium]
MYVVIEAKSPISLTKVLGKRIVDYTIDLAKKMDAKDIFVVCNFDTAHLGEVEGVKVVSFEDKDQLAASLEGDVAKFDGASIFYGGDDSPLKFENGLDVMQGTKKIKEYIVAMHLSKGVVIYDEATTFIGPDVKVEAGTQILPNTTIIGKTTIGKGCTIGPNTSLDNMQIGDNVEMQFCVASSSSVDDGAKVGPFAHIRPGCKIGKNTKIGNFVEVKNTQLGDGSKAGHHIYLGDA